MPGKTPEETDRLVGQAISEREIETLLDLFEPGAVFVDPTTGAELRGHDQIRDAVARMFESSPRIEGGSPPKVWISGDVALVLSHGHWKGPARGASVSVSLGRPLT